jgi:exonuclease SbcD
MEFLAEDDLLVLLRTSFDARGAILTPWDPVRQAGAWMDYGGLRFVGAGYLGAATPFKVRQLVAQLEGDKSHVLLLHAGPDYFVGEGGGFSESDLEAIHAKTSYLALGHIHLPMRHGDWACNPGSLENCDVSEARYNWDLAGAPLARGYAVLEIDPAQPQKPVDLQIRNNPRRPVHRLTLDCSPFGNKTKDGAAALVIAATSLIRAEEASPDSLIDLRLTGRLNLNRIALDPTSAAIEIQEQAEVFAVAVDLAGLDVGSSLTGSELAARGFSREELEKAAIRQVVSTKHLWGVDDREEDLSEFCYQLKEAVRKDKSAAELAEQIGSSPLLELIACASSATAENGTAFKSRPEEVG